MAVKTPQRQNDSYKTISSPVKNGSITKLTQNLNAAMDTADFGRPKTQVGRKGKKSKQSPNQRQPYSGNGAINIMLGPSSRSRLNSTTILN